MNRGIFMDKSLLLFQGVVILLMLFAAVLFILDQAYLKGILYIAIGFVFLVYSLAGRKKNSQ